MQTKKRSSILVVALTNIIILCLTQFVYIFMMDGPIEFNKFQLLYFPILLVFINLVLWFSKYRIEFFLHWIFAYAGYVCFIVIIFVIQYIQVDPLEYMPPGEAYFDLFLSMGIFVTIQVFILLCFNIVTYVLYIGNSYVRKKFLKG